MKLMTMVLSMPKSFLKIKLLSQLLIVFSQFHIIYMFYMFSKSFCFSKFFNLHFFLM